MPHYGGQIGLLFLLAVGLILIVLGLVPGMEFSSGGTRYGRGGTPLPGWLGRLLSIGFGVLLILIAISGKKGH